MFLTADMLLAHAVGDYIIQSDKMARLKSSSWLWAFIHAITYSIPFLFLQPSILALLTIIVTHAVIDHYGLARYIIFARNYIWDQSNKWGDCKETGFPKQLPDYLSKWLLIITDNILHVVINGVALNYL